MGFIPNSLYAMGKKPNILGAFSMLFVNIKGFSASQTSSWTGMKLAYKNLIWTIKAKKIATQKLPPI